MGLFDFLKKKENKNYIIGSAEQKNQIVKHSNSACKRDSIFYTSKISSGQRSLLFDFEDKYFDRAETLSDGYINICEDIEDIYDIDKRLKQCEKAINAHQKFKDFCHDKGEGGILFYEQWLHDDNTTYNDFINLERLNQEINLLRNDREASIVRLKKAYLVSEYGSVEEGERTEAEEKTRKEYLKKLRKNILYLIKNNPGILQKDIYSKLMDYNKSDIIRELDNYQKQGKIRKDKKGNTYELHLSQ